MKKKVLIVWGGWDGHTPEASVKVFLPLLESHGFEVELSDSLDTYLERDKLNSADLIIQCWTGGVLPHEHEKNLLDAIKGGTGFAGWHGGIIDSFHDNVNYHHMTGGQWVAHPGDIVSSYTVEVVDGDHPVTRGVDSFTLKNTEQYYLHVDPAIHVLCTTTFTDGAGATVMPYAWTKGWGEGRVFVAAWGHTDEDFQTPGAREIVWRGLLWAAGEM